MARITVEDCLKGVESRFELVHLAARRAKLLLKGAKSVVEADNKEIVTALREIAEGKVQFERPEEEMPEPSEEPIPQTADKSDESDTTKEE
jgi:DNA-directed RNA polymerase subunit omega